MRLEDNDWHMLVVVAAFLNMDHYMRPVAVLSAHDNRNCHLYTLNISHVNLAVLELDALLRYSPTWSLDSRISRRDGGGGAFRS